MQSSQNPITQYTTAPEVVNPVILLALQNSSDQELIRNFLSDDFTILSPENFSSEKFDLCMVDKTSLQRHKTKLMEWKEKETPTFSPVILLVKNQENLQTHHIGWDFADEIVSIPTSPDILRSRLELLLRQRSYTCQLEKQRIRLLEQNEQLKIFKKVFQATNNGVVITNHEEEDNPILYANVAFEKITGYSEKEITGKNCRFLQRDDRDQPGINSIRTSIQNGESDRQLVRNYKKDGTSFWNELSIAPVKNDDGKITHYVGIQNDVTDLINTQKQLEYEKKYIQAIIESLPGFFYMLDRQLNFTKWNNSLSSITGYSDQEIARMDPLNFFPKRAHGRVQSSIKKIFTTGHATMEVPLQTKSGEEFEYFFFARKITLDGNDFIIGSAVDISDRIEMEQQLKKSLREKEVLLQEIHHRVKNNLAVVSGMLQMQRYKSIDPAVQKVLKESESRIKTMALIHEKLYQSESLSSIAFNSYIQDLATYIQKTVGEEKQLHFEINCSEVQLNVNQAVPAALIVNEMLNNSVKHAFTDTHTGTITISISRKQNDLAISIKDNGQGLPAGFNLSEHSSMGLTIVRTLLKQLNADHTLHSQNGTNFSFTFTLKEIKGSSSTL